MKLNYFLMLTLIWQSTSVNAQSIVWEKNYGGTFAEVMTKVNKGKDGGYVFTSYTTSVDKDVTGNHGAEDFWVVKVDNSGELKWQTCLGGFSSDVPNWIEADERGGYIVAGNSLSNGLKVSSQVYGNHGNQDIWIVKLDDGGAIEWAKSFGGCDREEVRCVRPLSDGGYVVVGGTLSYNTGDVYGSHSDWDAWVIKISHSGDLLWQRTIGGSDIDYFYDVSEIPGGGFFVTGLSSSTDGDLSGAAGNGAEDLWIARLNENGDPVWSKTYGGSDYDGARSLCVATDGSLFVCGNTKSYDGDVTNNHGAIDIWALHLNADGDLVWQKAFGGTGDDSGFSIFQRGDSDFILTAETNTPNNGDVNGNHGGRDALVMKIGKDGAIKAKVCLGGSYEDFARSSVRGYGDTEIIVGGTSSSSDGDVSANFGFSDAWLVSLDIVLGLKPESPDKSGVSLVLLPNPVSDQLNVDTQLNEPKWIEMFDQTGKLIQRINTEKPDVSILTKALPAGKYVIKVTLEKTGQSSSVSFLKH